MDARGRRRDAVTITIAIAAVLAVLAPAAAQAGPKQADAKLKRAMRELVRAPDGPPGLSVVVQRGGDRRLYTAGRANLTHPGSIKGHQHMRIASVTKAVTGALALRLVAEGKMKLSTTIGQLRPDLPAKWAPITLRQLLLHTSGLPNYTADPAFLGFFASHLKDYISPMQAISYVFDDDLEFPPGTRFEYSNTDNIVIGLMSEAATGARETQLLKSRVFRRLGMRDTTLPSGFELPRPFIRGYIWAGPGAPPEDVSQEVSASSVWSAGGIVSTPFDMNRFIRGFAGGKLIGDRAVQRKLRFFLPPFTGGEPPGPGQNRAGLTLYRYKIPCGVVVGHSGNFPGYTQWIAASPDGKRSTVVTANLQMSVDAGPPELFKKLRFIYKRAACAALAG